MEGVFYGKFDMISTPHHTYIQNFMPNISSDKNIVEPSTPCALFSQLSQIKIKKLSKLGTKHNDSTEANEPRKYATLIKVTSEICLCKNNHCPTKTAIGSNNPQT